MTAENGPTVTVVGGGIAGLTAALKLAERGYQVTIYEDRPELGGNLSARRDPDTGTYHDVYPHMFSSFYQNFWNLVADVGLVKEEAFEPREAVKVLRKDHTYRSMTDGTPVKNMVENLFRGVQPTADMVIWAYSLLDLMSQHGNRDKLLDRYSVNGFMRSRPYSTNRAAALHDYALLVVWSAHSYGISAAPYDDFFRLSLKHPAPLTWVLKGDLYTHFIEHIENRLKALKVKINASHRVTRLWVGARGVTAIEIDETEICPDTQRTRLKDPPQPQKGRKPKTGAYWRKLEVDNVILALTPKALGDLAQVGTEGNRLVDRIPMLSEMRQSRAEPICVFNVYFKKKVPDIPPEHVSLWDSPMGLSFLDLSQVWDDLKKNGNTVLVVAASNYYGLPSEAGTNRGDRQDIQAMVDELRRYLPQLKDISFQKDVDWRRSQFLPNLGEELFINDVGSEAWRPKTVNDEVPNLFLAGDCCVNPVGMATVEAAVTTGLLAASALHEETPFGPPVVVPDHANYSDTAILAMKLAVMPYAYYGKWWSSMSDILGGTVDKSAQEGSGNAEALLPARQAADTARELVSLWNLPRHYMADLWETTGSMAASVWEEYFSGS